MKKSTVRIFAIVLAALMCLSLLPLTVAHAEEHVHVFEPTTIPPTCGEEGYVQMICEACGFGTEILEFIPPTGEHVFASVLGEDYLFQTSDNICETPEVYWKSCTVCGAPAEEAYELAKQRALDELNQRRANGEEHSDAEWQDMMQRVLDDIWANYTFTYGGEGHAWVAYDGQEATCEQDGWKPYRMCANCGAVEDYEVVPAKGHRWGEQTVVTEPTCDTEGLRRRVCEVCGKEDNEIIPALGHKYGEAAVIKAPTCTEDGMQQRVCSVCGAKADEVIPALGHKFGAYAVIKPATCTEDGVQERVCSVCGEKETEAIPAAHKFGEYVVTVEPGCYSSGEQVRTCTVCGATESMSIPAAHKFGAFVVTMEPTCYSTGERRSTCTVCGEEIVEWVDMAHKYENGVCVFCGEPAPEGYVAPAVEAAAVTETENTTETQDLILSDSETFDAGDGPFTVTFNANGGNFEPGFDANLWKNNVKGTSKPLPAIGSILRAGHTLMGWNTSPDGNGKHYYPAEEYTFYDDEILYAEWDVRITYFPNANDATGGPMQSTPVTSANVVLSPNEYSRSGYKFVKWNSKADGSGVSYEAGENGQGTDAERTISAPKADLALYAQWAKDPFTITFNSNGGTGTMAGMENRHPDEEFNLNKLEGITAPSGTKFKDWTTMKDGSGEHFTDEAKISKYTFTDDTILYAQWEEYNITITYHKGTTDTNCTGEMTPDTTAVNKAAKIKTLGYDYPGYEFVGWAVSETDPSVKYDKTKTEIPEGDVTGDIHLYAVWKALVKVTFKANNGTEVEDFQSVAEGVTTNLTSIEALGFEAPDNQEFDKWTTEADGSGTDYSDKDPYDFNAPLTLYAQWKPIKLKVTFNANGGNGTMSSQEFNKGEAFSLNKNEDAGGNVIITRDGYVFDGWNTEKTPTSSRPGTKFADGGNVSATAAKDNITLYAQWKQVVFTVTFNPNTGSGTEKTQEPPIDTRTQTSLTLDANSYTKDKYIFTGWNTAADGSGKPYTDQETIPASDFTENLYLYAQWKTVIVFDGNGADGGTAMTPQEITIEDPPVKVPIKKNTFTRTNYTFDSWNTAEDGSGDSYADEGNYTADTSRTLYAQWVKTSFAVKYDNNDGGGAMTDDSVLKGKSGIVKENTFNPPDSSKMFGSWLGSDGKTYNPGDKISTVNDENGDPIDITLSAQWKNKMYVIFHSEGEAEYVQQIIPQDERMTLDKNSFDAPVGKAFMGWRDDEGKTYTDEQLVKFTDDAVYVYTDSEDATGTKYAKAAPSPLNLYAVWEDLITVTFNANNGNSEETGIQQEVKGSTATLTAVSDFDFTAPTNKEFDCWNTVQEPTAQNPGTKYDDAASFPFSADTTLYAQWKPIVVTIRFEPGDGSRSTSTAMPPITVNAGSAQKLPKMSGFTLARHSFTGWSATADGAVLYADEASVPATATAAAGKTTSRTITLYARWEQTTFTISFAPSGGSGTMAAQNIDKNTQTSLTLRPNRFVKTVNDGESTITYKFMGWTTTSGGTTVIYEDGETIPADDIDEDMTLYAVWDTVIIFRAPDADAGSTMTPQSYDPKADTVTLKANTFTRENYRFESWRGDDGNTYANQETLYKDSATLTADKHKIPQSPLTLTAVWTRESYAVSYDPNGGGGTMDAQSVQVGQSVTLLDSEFTAKPGMIFGNWNTARDGSGSTFAPGATVMPTGDVTLYAQWKDPVNVYYYPGTGDGTYKIVEVPKDVETALKSPTDADLGYTAPAGQTFAHWKNNVTGETYRRNQKVTFSDDVSLTAVYADTIAISYDPNGGSLSVNGTTSTTARKFAAPKGEPYTLYTAEQLHLTRSGYEFKGWGQSESDRSPDYTDGGTYTFDGDKELFAIWQKHTFDGGVVVSGEISGIGYAAYVGETLTATAYDDYWKEFNYKWMRDDGTILRDSTYDYKKDGIDTSNVDWTTYVVQEDDYGHDIYCEVTAKGDEADTSIVKRSNVKTVTVEEDTKRIVNNGNTEQDYVYGLTSDMTYTVNSTDSSKGTKVVLDSYGRFAVTQSGTYRFYKKGTLQATVYVENWYTIGYATNGSGTVSLKLDNTSLTSSTRTFTGDLADKIEYYPHISGFTCWIVKEGASIGTFTLTVQGSSSNYTHVYLNEKLLDSFGSTTRTTTSSSSSSRTTTSSSSSSSTSTSRTYTVSTPLERDTRYTTAPWKMFEIVFNSTSSTSSPRTGDASNLGLWSALCLTSVTGTAAVLTTARKRRKSKG